MSNAMHFEVTRNCAALPILCHIPASLGNRPDFNSRLTLCQYFLKSRPIPTESEMKNFFLGLIPTESMKSQLDRGWEGRRDRPIANSVKPSKQHCKSDCTRSGGTSEKKY